MFQDLTKHINKDNLNKIKKKNRYLGQQQQKQIYQYNHSSPKSRQRSQSRSSKHSDDSISNYQLKEREQIFNNIIDSQQELQNYPIFSHQLQHQKWKYFTPQNKIKQLQRQLELSNQNRKIYIEIKDREMTHLKQQYQRKLQALNIEISIIKVKQSTIKRDQQLIKSLRKQNANLREVLQNKQKKIQQLTAELQFYKQDKSNKENLLLQIQNLKSLALYKKQCLSQNNNSTNLNINMKENQQVIELYKTQIKSSNEANNHLKRKCQQLQSQIFELKLKNQRISDNCQEEIRKVKSDNQKIIFQVQKLKMEKEKLEKSLMETMSQFSHHLHQMTNQSLRQSSQTVYPYSLKNSPYKINYEESQPRNRHYNQSTINLDQEQLNRQQNKSSVLNEESPITFRMEQKKTLNNKFENMSNKRKRIQSQNQVQKNRIQNKRYQELNNPQYNKNINQNIQVEEQIKSHHLTKIKRLQRKLEEANKKIVELIQEKLRRRSDSSFYA